MRASAYEKVGPTSHPNQRVPRVAQLERQIINYA
jgi:hypothetical protein